MSVNYLYVIRIWASVVYALRRIGTGAIGIGSNRPSLHCERQQYPGVESARRMGDTAEREIPPKMYTTGR